MGSFFIPKKKEERRMSMIEAAKLTIQFFWFEFVQIGQAALIGLIIHQIIYWTTGISLLNELIKATLKEVRK